MVPSTTKSAKGPKSDMPEVSGPADENGRSGKRKTCSSDVIEYKLSDPRFLDIGWTVKPSSRMVSQITQYETRMAKPHMNWFRDNRKAVTKYYDDRETSFVTFYGNGSGQVFYPNGALAIAVKRPEKRAYNLYTVFTPGGRDLAGRDRESQMLAAFDGLGNGIVLDDDNNTRLTYNQIGGIFRDTRTPRLWTWSLRRVQPKIETIDTEVPSAHLQKLLNLLAADSQKGAKTPKNDKVSEKNEKTIPSKYIGIGETISVGDSRLVKNVEFRHKQNSRNLGHRQAPLLLDVFLSATITVILLYILTSKNL